MIIAEQQKKKKKNFKRERERKINQFQSETKKKFLRNKVSEILLSIYTHTQKKRSENPKMIQSLPWIKSTETLINDDKRYSKTMNE